MQNTAAEEESLKGVTIKTFLLIECGMTALIKSAIECRHRR
jgi:hypothetical protein